MKKNNALNKRRVVITGMGAVSPYGLGCESLLQGLADGRCSLQRLEDKGRVADLSTEVVGLVPKFDASSIPRQHRRAMPLMGIFAHIAGKEALAQSGLPAEILASRRMGVMAGSTLGSSQALEDFFDIYLRGATFSEARTHNFFKIMSHTVSTSLSHSLNIKGRGLGLSGACATGGYAVGAAYEAIAFGRQDYVLCGGAEELHPLVTAVFDLMGAATQKKNDAPHLASRPFDRDRDGIACAEGAGLLVLEEYSAALARGAEILAEVVGFACNMTTSNLAHPGSDDIRDCMSEALEDAGLLASDIGYVSAHATATKEGDEAEGRAIAELFAGTPAFTGSLKGHLGHTMGASGALELIACVEMLRSGRLIPTLNLDNPDPRCGELKLFSRPVETDSKFILKNSFALGGVNTTLVIGKYND